MNKLSYKILVAIDDANRSNSHIDISDLLLKFRNRKHSAVDIDIAVEDLCIQAFLIDHDKSYNAFSGLEITTAGRNIINKKHYGFTNKHSDRKRPFYRSSEFWISAVIIPIVLFILGIYIS